MPEEDTGRFIENGMRSLELAFPSRDQFSRNIDDDCDLNVEFTCPVGSMDAFVTKLRRFIPNVGGTILLTEMIDVRFDNEMKILQGQFSLPDQAVVGTLLRVCMPRKLRSWIRSRRGHVQKELCDFIGVQPEALSDWRRLDVREMSLIATTVEVWRYAVNEALVDPYELELPREECAEAIDRVHLVKGIGLFDVPQDALPSNNASSLETEHLKGLLRWHMRQCLLLEFLRQCVTVAAFLRE